MWNHAWKITVSLAGMLAVLLLVLVENTTAQSEPLPGTAAWEHAGKTPEELSDLMVLGIDRFLLRETEESVSKRAGFWKRDLSSAAAYQKSVEPNRERLKWIFGLRDQRVADPEPQMEVILKRPSVRGYVTSQSAEQKGKKHTHVIRSAKWPVIGKIVWEGLWIEPASGGEKTVIIVPDAGQSPESLLENSGQESPLLPLLEQGTRVIIPRIISREVRPRRHVELTDREFIYRTSFEMGRHPAGYEIQAVLALVDYFKGSDPIEEAVAKVANKEGVSEETQDAQKNPGPGAAKRAKKLGVFGIGDGGLVALVAAAVDTRIDAAGASGYFGPRQNLWQEPIDRNLFGYLEQFGDAELATLIAPRPLILESAQLPEQIIETRGGGPGRIKSPEALDFEEEAIRISKLIQGYKFDWRLNTIIPNEAHAGCLSPSFTRYVKSYLLHDQPVKRKQGRKKEVSEEQPKLVLNFVEQELKADLERRQARLVDEITTFNQELLADSEEVRKQFFSKLDTKTPEKFAETVEPYRDYFRKQVIGEFEQPLLEPRPRSRKVKETEKWTSYEVMLDVFPDVVTHGVLLLPKNIPAGEKRPVVVCQHGLEGLPQHTFEESHRAYHDYGAKLAEEGFIVFAPQNPYRGEHLFRTLQRKANPLGKSLFSIIVPQHEQLTRWLGSLPEADADKIAFYGLSYGGKTAMRVPPLVKNYALSICSADFNDWIAKNCSIRVPFSYVWTKEYEIYEFDLGNTFNYAEMSALIAPRPFMVERGHFDGVGPDHWVASEFAKVNWIYKVRLGLEDRSEIEWFVGPHEINGQGAFRFLQKHLNYPVGREIKTLR